jgi:hypothetical protein
LLRSEQKDEWSATKMPYAFGGASYEKLQLVSKILLKK